MIEGGRRASASFGLAGGLAAIALMVVFLPFATLAVTRLTGWDWYVALAALIALNLVPVAGQLAMLGLAVIGAFTLGQDNLAQRKAMPVTAEIGRAMPGERPSATPGVPTQTAAAQPSGELSFIEWRKNVAAPAIQKSCLEDVQRRGLVDASKLDQMARACACYGAAAETVITEAEVEDGKLSPSPTFNERLAVEARKICQRK